MIHKIYSVNSIYKNILIQTELNKKKKKNRKHFYIFLFTRRSPAESTSRFLPLNLKTHFMYVTRLHRVAAHPHEADRKMATWRNSSVVRVENTERGCETLVLFWHHCASWEIQSQVNAPNMSLWPHCLFPNNHTYQHNTLCASATANSQSLVT